MLTHLTTKCRALGLGLLIVLSGTACGLPVKQTQVQQHASMIGYKYVYITPTQAVVSSGVTGSGDSKEPYTQTVNPRDIIAGQFMKRGYIVLPELDETKRGSILVVNYGQSDRGSLDYIRANTEVVLQLLSYATGEVVSTSVAQSGYAGAFGVEKATLKATLALFGER